MSKPCAIKHLNGANGSLLGQHRPLGSEIGSHFSPETLLLVDQVVDEYAQQGNEFGPADSGPLLERLSSLQMDAALADLLKWEGDASLTNGFGDSEEVANGLSGSANGVPIKQEEPPKPTLAMSPNTQKRMQAAAWEEGSSSPAFKVQKCVGAAQGGLGQPEKRGNVVTARGYGAPVTSSQVTAAASVNNGSVEPAKGVNGLSANRPLLTKSASFVSPSSTESWQTFQMAPRLKLDRVLSKAASSHGTSQNSRGKPWEEAKGATSSSSEERPEPKKERGGARVRFSNQQQEQLRALAEAVQWNTAAVDQTEASEEVCRSVGIDRKQLKKWIGNHRPKELRSTGSGGGNSAFSRSVMALRRWQTPGVPFPELGTPPGLMVSQPLPVSSSGDLIYSTQYPQQPYWPPAGGLPPLNYDPKLTNLSATAMQNGYPQTGLPSRRATGDWAGGENELSGKGKLKLKGDPERVKELVQLWMAARLRTLQGSGAVGEEKKESASKSSSRTGSPERNEAIDAVVREAMEVVDVAAGDEATLKAKADDLLQQPSGADLEQVLASLQQDHQQRAKKKDGLVAEEPQQEGAVSGAAAGLGFQGKANKTETAATLFEMELTKGDTTHLGRIILPTVAAEAHLPQVDREEGIKLLVEDSSGGRWCFRYRSYPRHEGRMYALEHSLDFIKDHGLEPGDALIFCRSVAGHLVIRERKRRASSDVSTCTTEATSAKQPTIIELTSDALNEKSLAKEMTGGSTTMSAKGHPSPTRLPPDFESLTGLELPFVDYDGHSLQLLTYTGALQQLVRGGSLADKDFKALLADEDSSLATLTSWHSKPEADLSEICKSTLGNWGPLLG